LVDNATVDKTSIVSVESTVSPEPQSTVTDCDTTTAAEVSSVSSSSAAESCDTTDTTGVQDVANVCVSAADGAMAKNVDGTIQSSQSDSSSACNCAQVSIVAFCSYTPVVATSVHTSITDSTDLELGNSVSDYHYTAVPSEIMSTNSAHDATATEILDMKLSSLVTVADSSSVTVSDAHTSTKQTDHSSSLSSICLTNAAESSHQTDLTANGAANDTESVSTQTANADDQLNSIDSSMYDHGSSDLTVQRGCTPRSANRSETPVDSSSVQYSNTTGVGTSAAATPHMASSCDTSAH
jgi:hypothetical protein